MANSPSSRRGFLLGTACGLAAGGGLMWLGRNLWDEHFATTATQAKPESVSAPVRMPGPYPGRVVEVRHEHSVRKNHTIDADAVKKMVHQGMSSLTEDGWRSLFDADDVVGIKVNPVGRKRGKHDVGSITNPEPIVEIVDGLKSAGVKARNIFLFERYANEFVECGYADLLTTRPMEGVRWLAFGGGVYDGQQVAVDGFDKKRSRYSPELEKHVVGYDPDVFTTMGYCSPEHDLKDDRRFRSHVSAIVTRLVSKVINVPVLKDHRSAGVTLALKNISHGMCNNVARSHLSGLPYGFHDSVRRKIGPNQCNTFIPQAASQKPFREKVVLHIMDGLIGVYEGGPGSWNKTWSTWHHKGLFFATDPVALDHVGWDIIDAKRLQEGWPVVGEMGLAMQSSARNLANELHPIGAMNPMAVAMMAEAIKNRREGRASEAFDLRTPQHIRLAEGVGLGVFEAERIEHRVIRL